jgi:hypothetical protein
LTDAPLVRPSVPQGRHGHYLQPEGLALIEGWFSGFTTSGDPAAQTADLVRQQQKAIDEKWQANPGRLGGSRNLRGDQARPVARGKAGHEAQHAQMFLDFLRGRIRV